MRAAPFLREQSDFAMLEVRDPSEIVLFRYFSAYSRTTGVTMQTLYPLELFLCPMDRAEVLHVQNYNLRGRRKNTPGENELVLSCEIITFPSNTYI